MRNNLYYIKPICSTRHYIQAEEKCQQAEVCFMTKVIVKQTCFLAYDTAAATVNVHLGGKDQNTLYLPSCQGYLLCRLQNQQNIYKLNYSKIIQQECIIAKYQWLSWITSTQSSTNKRHPPYFSLKNISTDLDELQE